MSSGMYGEYADDIFHVGLINWNCEYIYGNTMHGSYLTFRVLVFTQRSAYRY